MDKGDFAFARCRAHGSGGFDRMCPMKGVRHKPRRLDENKGDSGVSNGGFAFAVPGAGSDAEAGVRGGEFDDSFYAGCERYLGGNLVASSEVGAAVDQENGIDVDEC